MTSFDDRAPSSRRLFLRDLAAVGLGSGAALSLWAQTARGADVRTLGAAFAPIKPTVDRIGVQLYTVGDQLRTDFDGTIEKVAQIGYKYVEFAGYGNKSPEEIRATLDRLHLKSPSTHIGMDLLRKDLAAQIHIAQVIGHEYITIPSLGRTETPMTTADAWKQIAAECNAIGAKLKAAGLKLDFHSHSGEFVDVGGGKTGMDVFITETDPSLFNFQMDLGWARVASQDPVAWFKKYPGRFTMWHIKDFENLKAAQDRQTEAFRNPPPPPAPRPAGPPAGAPPAGGPPAGGPPAGGPPGAARMGGGFNQPGKPAPIGAGDIDFRPIFAAWKQSGMEYFFVEQDAAGQWPGGSMAAITTSYQALKKLLA